MNKEKHKFNPKETGVLKVVFSDPSSRHISRKAKQVSVYLYTIVKQSI